MLGRGRDQGSETKRPPVRQFLGRSEETKTPSQKTQGPGLVPTPLNHLPTYHLSNPKRLVYGQDGIWKQRQKPNKVRKLSHF